MTDRRHLTFFLSDVHLGLEFKDPAARESRFVAYLKSLPAAETESLYLLGDIWDFWYEYHDVVPKGSFRVFCALCDLMEAGVKVYFMKGNHDMWAYSYFRSLGITVLDGPICIEIAGKDFCLAHGDGLGPGMYGYKLMKRVFSNPAVQRFFSCLHPRLLFHAFKSRSPKCRLVRNLPFIFREEKDPLYIWADAFYRKRPVDYFIFGHYHTAIRRKMPCGAEFCILKDWMGQPYSLYFDGISGVLGNFPKME